MPTTIHFEGIAGSGKSTASETFCRLLRHRGVSAAWWLEELADHPVMPKAKRVQAKQAGFAELCLDAWQVFLSRNTQEVSRFDGCAFQSTVRFLFEQGISHDQIQQYFCQWQELSPNTAIIYLVVNDSKEHYEKVFAERGEEWTDKLIAWVQQTPIGKSSNFRGEKGFIEFWRSYQDLCLGLLDGAFVRVHLLEARLWRDADLEGLAITHKLGIG